MHLQASAGGQINHGSKGKRGGGARRSTREVEDRRGRGDACLAQGEAPHRDMRQWALLAMPEPESTIEPSLTSSYSKA